MRRRKARTTQEPCSDRPFSELIRLPEFTTSSTRVQLYNSRHTQSPANNSFGGACYNVLQ
jgi:hypothetical protein